MPAIHVKTISPVALAALVIAPGVALAEVSDKEPAIQLFWTIGLATALGCLLLGRCRPWLAILFFAPVALWFMSLFLEIHSADVGPHLRREQGTFYYIQAYAAFALALCGLVAGCIWHRRRTVSPPTTLQ